MKQFAILIVSLLIGLVSIVTPSPLRAQSNITALFLGQDSGHTLLYRAALDGSLTALTKPEAGDVLVYTADSAAAAYIAQGADKALILSVLDLNSLALVQAPLSSTQVTQIVLTDSAVALVTRNADGKPTLLTFDRTTLQPIAQHSTQHNDSVFTIQAGGKWAMAYNAAGALDVFSLPGLTTANFDLVDFAYTEPAWSPAKGQLQFIGSTSAQPNDRFIDVIDFDAGTSQHYALPAANGTQEAQWSAHGRYVLTFSRRDQGTILLTDATSGVQTTLSEPGFTLTPISWSGDDSWLLYTAQISASGPVDLFAFDVAGNQSHPIHDLNNSPLTARWASDSNQLLVIAQGGNQTLGLFTVAGPSFDTWQPLIPSVDAGIVQAFVQWKGTAIVLEYAGTLLTVDSGTHAVLRLSPQSVQVIPGSTRLIG